VLIVPRALAAPAFEHVDDGARAGGDHRSNQLQSFTAGTAALVRRLAFQDGNLFAEKQIHDRPQITLTEIICQVPGKSNGIILIRITLGRNVAILHRGSGGPSPAEVVAIRRDGWGQQGTGDAAAHYARCAPQGGLNKPKSRLYLLPGQGISLSLIE
jgi:hypothetical protein